jgi:hypothetical protein
MKSERIPRSDSTEAPLQVSMPMDASTGLVGKKCKSRFNGDGGFFNSRILAYFSDKLKRKGSPLRSPLASQIYLRFCCVLISSGSGEISEAISFFCEFFCKHEVQKLRGVRLYELRVKSRLIPFILLSSGAWMAISVSAREHRDKFFSKIVS